MSPIAQRLALQYDDAVRRVGRGATVTLRRITRTNNLANPPTFNGVTTSGALAQGATTIALVGSSAYGHLVEGDKLTIAGQTYTVAGDAPSTGPVGVPGFPVVTISPGLLADVPDGTPVTPTWSADLTVYAMVQSFPRQLVNGAQIIAGDLRVGIPAFDASRHPLPEPLTTWMLQLGGKTRTIVDVQPVYVSGDVVKWDLQAR